MSNVNRRLQRKARALQAEQNIPYGEALVRVRRETNASLKKRSLKGAADFTVESRTRFPSRHKPLNDAMRGGFRRGVLAQSLGKSGSGKTLQSLQDLMYWTNQGYRCIFLTLEQKSSSIYERMEQTLDNDFSKEPASLALHLMGASMQSISSNLVLVDNVPGKNERALVMTPQRIAAIIDEITLIQFGGKPCDIVVIDHLGIISADPSPANEDPELSVHSHQDIIIDDLASIAEQKDVFIMMLRQLYKADAPGVVVDDSRYRHNRIEYTLTTWRPEHIHNLTDEERLNLKGKIKVMLTQNSDGPITGLSLDFHPELMLFTPSDEPVFDEPERDGFDQSPE